MRAVSIVWIVEDDPATRELFEDVLRSEDLLVRTFESAAGVSAALASVLPEVIVLDLALGPGDTGIDLARSVRRDRRTSHVALIAVTGTAEPEWDVMQFFDAYLRKPVEVDILGDLVARLGDNVRTQGRRSRYSTPP